MPVYLCSKMATRSPHHKIAQRQTVNLRRPFYPFSPISPLPLSSKPSSVQTVFSMPPPGAFQGSRKKFLEEAKEAYAAAVEGGYVRDEIAQLWRRYFKRFPIDLPHDEEPSPEHLDAVNDDAPDEEVLPPDPETLSPDDYQTKLDAYEWRRRLIVFRKAVSNGSRSHEHN